MPTRICMKPSQEVSKYSRVRGDENPKIPVKYNNPWAGQS